MGHTLGLVGVVAGVPFPWFDQSTDVYTGAMALEGWRRTTGSPVSSLQTNAGHWLLPGLFDVMNAGGSGPLAVPPLSLVSVGALMDLGYPARWEGAGPCDAVTRVP